MKNNIILILAVLLVGIFVGWFIRPSSNNQSISPVNHQLNDHFTCSMHPTVRQKEPGNCPICAMELIPVDEAGDGGDPTGIRMSPTAMQLANVQTAIVQKQQPIKEIVLNGKVKVDESKVFVQTAHLSGRIERLMVNTTGEYVRKGQTIAYVYSPELVTAQNELVEANKIKDLQPALFQAAREKLKNWKLTNTQIDNLLLSDKQARNFPFLSHLNGVVLSKLVSDGDHVMEGSSLFEIADLSHIWVLFDIYESELSWVKVGDKIQYTIQSLPGQYFNGEISFIDPVIDPATKVARARVSVRNEGLLLKPEMLASGTLFSQSNEKEEIIVPKSAVMWTGKRSLVYVKAITSKELKFEMREITLGPVLGDGYVIESGLREGEEIVVNGTFSIDAAAQLAGKPSMMNRTTIFEISSEEGLELAALYDRYFELKDHLVNDDYEQTMHSAKNFQELINTLNKSLLNKEANNSWMAIRRLLIANTSLLLKSNSIEMARMAFIGLSKQMIFLGTSFAISDKTYYVQHCPMADGNNGADWLSLNKEIRNPYFGASMLTCGEVIKEIKNF